MTRALALLLALLASLPAAADMYQDAKNAKLPEARQNLELGTVRSEGGTPPNADAVTRFYTYAPTGEGIGAKVQFQINSEPNATDYAIEQAGNAGNGATRVCTTTLGTVADCNYASVGVTGRHLFGNGAGVLGEFGFESTGSGSVHANGWAKFVATNAAIARLEADGTTDVSLELQAKGTGTVSVASPAGLGSFVVTTPSGTGSSVLSSTANGVQIAGVRHVSQTIAGGTNAVPVEDSGKRYHNRTAGASPTTFQLPSVNPLLALNYCFLVEEAGAVIIKADPADRIAFGGTNSAVGGQISSSQPYASVCIEALKAGQWHVWATADKTQWTVL